jgi:hypothetical protein
MLKMMRALFISGALAVGLAAPCAWALTPADQTEIQNFTLTPDFLQRYAAITVEAHARHQDTSLDGSDLQSSSLDNLTASIVKRSPQAPSICQAHGLALRQVIVGGLVLARAAMANQMMADPKTAKYVDKAKVPSEANMTFFRAHQAQIVAMFKKAEEVDPAADDK